MEILKDIPFKIDLDNLFSALHLTKESEDAEGVLRLADIAGSVARPKAVYDASYINAKDYDKVDIGGTVFTSRVLRVNLSEVERVFPYVATCGAELDGIEIKRDDFVRQFWLDTIKSQALDTAVKYLAGYLKSKYALGRMSSMNPGAGSQDLWPIEQQKQLFSILGNVKEYIGVSLTESFLMTPNKTVSGIYFPTEASFESCQVCPRERCPGRKAKYNEKLLKSYHE